jgi:hypothetical protein
MTRISENRSKIVTWTASLLVAGSLAFSPVLFPAVAAQFNNGSNEASKNWIANFTPAGVDSKLAAKFKRPTFSANASNAIKTRFPFTPAGTQEGVRKTLTIAARTDSILSSKAVSTRNAISAIQPGLAVPVNLNKTDFRLTAARGWKDFKLPDNAKAAVKAPMSNLSAGAGTFRLDGAEPVKKSRFKTDVKLDTARQAAPSPRGNAAAGEYKVGLESSFSLSRRVDLTAGVTYNSERDRVTPRTDDRKDSEAVYVGTKIRF